MQLDLNRLILADRPINRLLNELIEAAEPQNVNERQYLGASSIGSECLRKVQYDWMCDAQFPARTMDIFDRGHFFEEVSRRRLKSIGFKFAPKNRLKFETAGGLLRGHADGILIDGPAVPDLIYPAIWEHKALQAKSWRAIERDGLTGIYEVYAAQIAIYQACLLDVTNPALFTVTNADNCERLHFLVPFDPVLAQIMSDRAVTVIEATRAGELLSRITEDPTDWRCRMCAHKDRCWGDQCV